MKNLLIIILVFVSVLSFSQINLNSTTSGTTVNTCGETLYDSGGPSGDYSPSEDYTITFCSSTAGECPEISFASVALESGYDYVYIYDGTSSSDPLLATVNGSTIPANTIASVGCITIVMHSDGSVQQGGFQLSVNCTANCYVPPPPPTNDGPCSAYTLTVDTVCVTETHTTLGATDSGIPAASCGFSYSGGDVWFEAVVPASGLFSVESFAGSMPDGGIAIYTGPDCNTLTEHMCEEAWSGFPGQQLTMASAGLAGQTVWIRIWDPNNDGQGTFNICAYEPPPMLDVDTTVYTPTELVEDVLVTGCLQAMNTQFHGPDSAIGYFTNGDIIGMESGLVLACGKVTDISGIDEFHDSFTGYTTTQPGIASDLLTVANNNTTGVTISSIEDLVVLEFDFIPSSDTTEFEFVFASEEYQGYECTSYNDAFAFFVSGPGISGPYTGGAINIAVVPGTTDPVTISTINGVAGCGPNNSQYYINNTANPMMNVNGFTTPLTATMAGLTPCETYHIRFVIGDAGDQILNSYVFFEEASFSSGGDVTMGNNSDFGTTSDIFEGCENFWVFDRVDTSVIAMQDTIFIELIETGTAIPGVDYTTSSTTLMILPGEYTDTLFYSAIWDNIAETNEYVIFSLLNGCPCTMSSTDDTIWFFDNFNLDPIITPDQTICFGTNVTVDVTINPLQDPASVEYLWDDGSTGTSINVTPIADVTHSVTVSAPCQTDTTVQMTITVIPIPDPSFTVSKDTICLGEDLTITFTGALGVAPSYLWDFNGGSPTNALTVGPHIVNWNTSGGKTISLDINDTGCLADSTIDIFVSPAPVITITPTNNLCFGDCGGELLAAPQDIYIPYTYSWSDTQTANPAIGLCVGQYDVTVLNKFNCEAQFSGQITEPTEMTISTTGIDIECFGGTDGEATTVVANGTVPYIYGWTGPSGFTANTASISNLITGWYYIGAADANNCTVVDSIFINQPDSPLTSNISGVNIDCFSNASGNVYLEPTGGTMPYTFVWSNTTLTSQNLIGVVASQYDVTITDSHNCIGYNTITLTEPSQLVNNSIIVNPTTCWGYNDGTAAINVSGSVPPYLYTWSHGGTGQDNYNDLYAGNYIVTVVDDNGCQIIVNGIEVQQPSKLQASIGIVPTICIGQDIDLISSVAGGISPYTYSWNTGSINDRINVSPVDTTNYTLTVTDVDNCISITERVVNVYAPISMNLTADVNEICPGDPVLINVYPTGGNGVYTFTANDGIIPSPHIIYPQGTITYTVTVSDNCGSPIDFASVDIISFPKPPLSFISDVTHGCQPLTVQFSEQSPEIGQTYTWDFGDGSSSSTGDGKNPVHIYQNWGIFDVQLDVESVDGCKNSFTFNHMIEVYKLPIAKFNAYPEVVSILKPEISFFNYSVDNHNNYWYFGDGDMSGDHSPIHNYDDYPDSYIVKLVVESKHGCLDSTFSSVTVENVITIYVPTAFSPDNDGINDTFYATGNGLKLDEFEMKIYDRWGEIIFESHDMHQGWDGNVKGRPAQSGVYKWLITYVDETGIEYQKSGTVTLIK